MNQKKKGNKGLWIALGAAAVVVLAVVLVLVLRGGDDKQPGDESGKNPVINGEVSINVGSGLRIVDIGAYTGMYMEDGSNEVVSGVLMCIVTNEGDRAVEYAQLQLHDGERDIPFTLTALQPGRSVVLLAQDKTAYDKDAAYTATVAESVAFFANEPSLQADRLQIQGLDGGMNITNISNKDITGDVVVYYKNVAADGLLYGGITYRTRISGGIKAGELKQGMTEHFRVNGSEVLFVTVAE